MTGTDTPPVFPTKTVAVLGASYGGARAARLLSLSLPAGWKLVVIDRNSHMNHVYVFPRFTILPAHAPKAYVPYTNILSMPPPSTTTTTSKPRQNSCSSKLRPAPPRAPPTPPLSPSGSSASSSASPFEDEDPRTWIQGSIVSMTPHSVTITRPTGRRDSSASIASIASTGSQGTFQGPEEIIYFDYAVYALGSGMPDPVNVWSEHPNMPQDITHDHYERGLGTKRGGIRWMQRRAASLEKAARIVIVGAGALGIQFATDLKSIYPNKQVTLLHSRERMMPLYPIAMHDAILDTLQKLGVDVVLGDRVAEWPDEPEHLDGKPKILRTTGGRTFEADLVLPCTGQKPHIQVMSALSSSAISKTTARIRVHPTMQVSNGPPSGCDQPRGAPPSPPPSNRGSANGSPRVSAPDNTAGEGSGSGSGAGEEEGSADEMDKTEPDLKHIFAVGDCAETGAIQAGHTAYWQAEVAARNILRLIEVDEGRKADPLETYRPGPPAIKVTLGLKTAVTANGDEVKVTHDGVEDLNAMIMWPTFQAGGLHEND